MHKVFLFTVVTMCAMLVSCTQPAAQTEEKEYMEDSFFSDVEGLHIACNLAKYGYKTGSPSALIEAADIFAFLDPWDFDAAAEKGPDNANETEKVENVQFHPEQLIADARELTDDPHLLAIADKVLAELNSEILPCGARSGANYAYGRVSARSYVCYDLTCYASRIAEVSVVGDGDTDLDLYIYDEDDHLIASATDYTDDCFVRLYPRRTALYRVKIVNRGGVYNNYVIAVN